ncbi:hypothetical protein B5807_06973 [Epicoccum nigrum]|uniref:Uncharacterized protein n=1 Tax=Epicoccum nigrum TaxID=105696 RepID=A0A1Y2LXS9_EPING|nr:hypothetical protein B5807_06973 [Epicoccum nigrum]
MHSSLCEFDCNISAAMLQVLSVNPDLSSPLIFRFYIFSFFFFVPSFCHLGNLLSFHGSSTSHLFLCLKTRVGEWYNSHRLRKSQRFATYIDINSSTQKDDFEHATAL